MRVTALEISDIDQLGLSGGLRTVGKTSINRKTELLINQPREVHTGTDVH